MLRYPTIHHANGAARAVPPRVQPGATHADPNPVIHGRQAAPEITLPPRREPDLAPAPYRAAPETGPTCDRCWRLALPASRWCVAHRELQKHVVETLAARRARLFARADAFKEEKA